MKQPTHQSEQIIGPGQTYHPTDKVELINQYIFEIHQYAKADYIAKHTGWVGRQFWFVRDAILKRLPNETELAWFDDVYFSYYRSPFGALSRLSFRKARKRLTEVMK